MAVNYSNHDISTSGNLNIKNVLSVDGDDQLFIKSSNGSYIFYTVAEEGDAVLQNTSIGGGAIGCKINNTIIGESTPSTGYFTELAVNGTGVSLTNHSHSSFPSLTLGGFSGPLTTFLDIIVPSGFSLQQYEDTNVFSINNIEDANLVFAVDGKGKITWGSIDAANVNNFNDTVTSLLPTIANSGNNRILTSTGDSVGINAESNLTFDGNLLSVTGSGNFTNGVTVNDNIVWHSGNFDSSNIARTIGNQAISGYKTFNNRVTVASNVLSNGIQESQILLNGSTNNRIEFNGSGVGDPSLFFTSNGKKILLHPSRSTGAAEDFSIGIAGDGSAGAGTPTRFWQSIKDSSSRFQWYAAATNIATLTGSGIFSTTGGLFSGDITASGSFIAGSGSGSNPSFEFVGDADTGMFSPEANTMALATSGVERLRIDSVGRVGIGTSSPTQRLDINGNGLVSSGLYIGSQPPGGILRGLYIRTNDESALAQSFLIQDSLFSRLFEVRNDGNAQIGNFTSTTFSNRFNIKGSTSDSSAGALNIINSGDSPLFFVRNDGNILCGGTPIGATYPRFFIKSPTSSINDSSIQIENSNYNTIFELKNNSNVVIGGNNGPAGSTDSSLGIKGTTSNSSAYAIYSVNSNLNQLFAVRNDGRVGIGTNQPSGQFHVIGTGIISSRLGINTNSPTVALDVSGTISANSGNFTSGLFVGPIGSAIPVSISGHHQLYSTIDNFCTGVAECVNTPLLGGTGISLSYVNGTGLYINAIYSSGNFSSLNINGSDVGLYDTSVFSLGTISGTRPIDCGKDRQIQTVTLNGTATTFTKGTGWPTSSSVARETTLNIFASGNTNITWTIVNDWYAQPASPLPSGRHIILLRSIGSGTMQGHYIGNKTN